MGFFLQPTAQKMSETTETKTNPQTETKGELGPSLLGCEILVRALEREGVGVDSAPCERDNTDTM